MARKTQAEWDAHRKAVKAEAAEVVKANAEEARATLKALREEQRTGVAVTTEVETEVEGYATWTNAELADELKERGLPHSGTKDELVARLTEDDESEDE